MAARTRAIEVAEGAGIVFRVHAYRHDPGAAYGPEAAEKLGVAAARVFKTLVVQADGRPLVAVLPLSLIHI